jgi:glycosyltransferase involved in cell wall biosynthesis
MRGKILLIIKTPPPITGVTTINEYILNNQTINARFDISSICINYAKKHTDLRKFSITKLLKFVSTGYKIGYRILIFRPQLIYFQISPLGKAFYRDFFYVLLIKIFRVKTIFHLHGKGIYESSNKSKFRKLLYRFAFHSEELICLSELLVSDISEVFKGIPYIVNNGIQSSVLSDSYKKLGTEVTILFLSNLYRFKGVLDFLEALRLLTYDRIDYKAIIVGEEGDISINEIEHRIVEYGLKRFVYCLGGKYNIEKMNILSESDILAYPTKEDAFPLVLLEAMQAGLPIVATKVGAIPEIIDDGETGFLIDKNSPSQLAQKIKILINDLDLRTEMGLKGKDKYLNKYTIDKFEENLAATFLDILEKQNPITLKISTQ